MIVTRLRWVFAAYDEIIQSWCFANDHKSFEHTLMETTAFMVGHVSISVVAVKLTQPVSPSFFV